MTTLIDPSTASSNVGSSGYGTRSYRALVLIALTSVYAINYIDRSLVSYLQEPIKTEFGLTDLQLGLLGGPAFALLYGLMGIPIARLAERRTRTTILAWCLAAWSFMTAVCGLAASYAHLFLARMGVSVGEAGCTPAAQSILSDYFPRESRATALGIYASGSSIGGAFGAVACGWIAQEFGWRAAFLALGIPGILLAIVLPWIVKEPPRPPSKDQSPPLARTTFVELWRKPTFRWVMVGSIIGWMVALGTGQYNTSYLMRSHGLSIGEATTITGGFIWPAAASGIFLGGFLADRLQRRFPLAILTVPGIGLIVAAPLAITAFLTTSVVIAALCLALAAFTVNLFSAPMYALTIHMVQPNRRAIAIAIVLLLIALFGNGMGPPIVGWLSDLVAAGMLRETGAGPSDCVTMATEVCATAAASGLRYALAISAGVYALGGAAFLLARKTFMADRVD